MDGIERLQILFWGYIQGKQNKNITLRKRVGLVLGVAASTVGECTFTPHQNLGRPKSQPGEDITSLLRTHIMNSNKTGQ